VQVEAGVLVVNEAGASSRCEVVVAGADIAEIYVSGDGDVHGEGTFIALERIEVTGRGNVELPVVSSPVLDVRIRGTGNVSIGWQDSEVAGYDLAGDGSFTAAGRVSEGTLDLSGNGDFHGSELVFDRLDARLSGNGDAELNIAGSANLTVNGAGSVTVWGAGDVYAVTGGSGTVTFAE
jgi:hypothetical protein